MSEFLVYGDRAYPGVDAMDVAPVAPIYEPQVPLRQYETARALKDLMTPRLMLLSFTGSNPIRDVRVQFQQQITSLIGFQVVGLHCGNLSASTSANATDSLFTVHSSRWAGEIMGERTLFGAPASVADSTIIGLVPLQSNVFMTQQLQTQGVRYYFRRPITADYVDISIRQHPSETDLVPGATTVILDVLLFTLPNPRVGN